MGFVRQRTRSRRRWAPALIAALSLGFAACGSATPVPSTSASSSADFDDNVPEALQFTAELVGGGTFSGPSTAGQPVVMWFWAPT